MIGRIARTLIGFALGAGLSLAAASVVMAVCCGDRNGLDSNLNGWIGDDTPNDQYSWAYGQGAHDLILLEWGEPSHDWVRNQDMDWSYAGAVELNEISDTRNFEFDIDICNQYYYNGRDNWNTNVPYSKAPKGSSFVEEDVDNCTEVEMEMSEPYRIHNASVYFWDQQYDSERSAVSGSPTFNKWLENCNEFWYDCGGDWTGMMRKKVLQQ